MSVPSPLEQAAAELECELAHQRSELTRLRLALEARTQEKDRRAIDTILSDIVDPSNHHNALLCPYCNPDRLNFVALKAAKDDAKAKVQALEAELKGLAAEMRTEYATSGYRRLLHYAERLKEALVRPTEPQKGKD